IVALLQVPLAIIQFLVQVTVGNGAFLDMMRFSSRAPTLDPGQSIFDAMPLGQILTFYAITLALAAFQYLVVQNLITGALANAIGRTYLGRPITILGAYGFGARRYAALILASLLPFAVGVVLFALFAGCAFGGLAALGVGSARGSGALAAVALIVLLVFGLL